MPRVLYEERRRRQQQQAPPPGQTQQERLEQQRRQSKLSTRAARAAIVGGANASSLPADCIVFGGLAAGTNDPNGYLTVRRAVSRGAFCRPPCLRVYLHRRRLVLAATAGQERAPKAQEDPTYSPSALLLLLGCRDCFRRLATVRAAARLPCVLPPLAAAER